jgi:DNA-binding NarL/FixJ family response regulator
VSFERPAGGSNTVRLQLQPGVGGPVAGRRSSRSLRDCRYTQVGGDPGQPPRSARRRHAAGSVTGETARKRTVETTLELTAQEAQIARQARDGLSNPQIGTRMFISRNTVQYHLSKVFTKLGISSRSQLDRVLPGGPGTVQPR